MASIAPHICSGCGIEGLPLCGNCKYDIVSEPFVHCAACASRPPGASGICGQCDVYYARTWCVADRREQLLRLIDGYKFRNIRSAYKPLTELLDIHLPDFPENVVIVPIPTIGLHIRQRGYDHMLLVAREFGKRRGLKVDTCLQRATSSVQRSAGKSQRITQAKEAFSCKTRLDTGKIYLLIDDVITTGATMQFAAKTLKDAGASEVWAVSISRQPLDK